MFQGGGLVRCRRVRILALPRPPALQLDLQGHAQESPNQDDQAQDEDTLERRHNGHGPNDVGRNEKLQSEQDPTPEVLAEPAVTNGFPEASHGVAGRSDQQPKDDRQDTDTIYRLFECKHGSTS